MAHVLVLGTLVKTSAIQVVRMNTPQSSLGTWDVYLCKRGHHWAVSSSSETQLPKRSGLPVAPGSSHGDVS